MPVTIDPEDLRGFLDGRIQIDAFRNKHSQYCMDTRVLVGLIIASHWMISPHIKAIDAVPLGRIMRRIYPFGEDLVNSESLLSRSRRNGWQESPERGVWAVSNIHLPDEVLQLLKRYEGTPPGVAAFLDGQPSLIRD